MASSSTTALAVAIVALIVSVGGTGYLAATQPAPVNLAPIQNEVKALRERVAALDTALREKVATLEGQLGEVRAIAPYDPQLVAGAKKEGSVTVYSVFDQKDMALFKQEFEREFPGVTMNFVTAKNPELIARIKTEAQANQKTWDVFATSGGEILLATQEGKVTAYKSPQATVENYPIVDPTGKVTWFSSTIPVVIFNTQTVNRKDLAFIKTWEDLANPVLKKYKILMDLPSRGGPFSLVLAQLQSVWKDDAKYEKYLQDLAALNPRYFKSTGQMFSLIVAGEGDIAIIGLLHDVLEAKPRGAPVDFIQVAPVVLNVNGLVVNQLAPHPNAAKLFIEWMLSRTGQLVFAQTLRSPLRLGLVSPSSLSNLFPKLAAKDFVGLVNETWLKDSKAFLSKWFVPIFGPG